MPLVFEDDAPAGLVMPQVPVQPEFQRRLNLAHKLGAAFRGARLAAGILNEAENATNEAFGVPERRAFGP
jgi:hypothetical protein